MDKVMRRRDFLSAFGAMAFAGVANGKGHHNARAKSVIYLFMEGGPSQVDTFDPKPILKQRAGEPLPFKNPATVFNSSNKLMPSPFEFARYGESGSSVSSIFPHVASCVDDLTFIHSMHHNNSNHSEGCLLSHTGASVAGFPSMGSWITYGLGSSSQNLPGYVVLDCGQTPSAGAHCYSNGFLPAPHAGTPFRTGDNPVEFLTSSDPLQGQKLEAIRSLYRDAKLPGVLSNYEKAARMQTAVPELMDLSEETERTKRLYGMEDPRCSLFGSRCLIARRLVERGIRFIELFSPRVKADRWDQHGGLKQGHTNNSVAVDQPIAGLIKDLKQRGLLEETIVLWGGEFGRTPSSQGSNGRDHNPHGYTVFLAGGGFKPGVHHGATDEFGYYAQQDKVHIHDLHATILHQLGIDHERLTYRFGGRDYRLTDVHGNVVKAVLS